MDLIRVKDKLIHEETGLIVASTAPKFQDRTYEQNVSAFPHVRYLEPMKGQDGGSIKAVDENAACTIAEIKWDGFRELLQMGPDGNRLFSYNIVKKNDWFGECTDNVPHLRDMDIPSLYGTILDGEIIPASGDFSELGGIAGPNTKYATAIDNQLTKGFAHFKAFDILYYKGINVRNFPLWRRKIFLAKAVAELPDVYSSFVEQVPFYVLDLETFMGVVGKDFDILPVYCVESFQKLCEDLWEQGYEGMMTKDWNSPYRIGKRAKEWKKFKELFHKDVIILNINPPVHLKDDEGKTPLDKWPYWEDSKGKKMLNPPLALRSKLTAVSKPYFYGWPGSVGVGVWKPGDKKKGWPSWICDVKGMSDAVLKEIAEHAEEYCAGDKVIEIKFNNFLDPKAFTPRHPRFSRFRPDKTEDMCTWESWKKS